MFKFFPFKGRPSRAIFKSEPMGNSADSYNLTWKIDSYAPIEEYKLMFRKLFVSLDQWTIETPLVETNNIDLTVYPFDVISLTKRTTSTACGIRLLSQ